jgi:hypothetical protein
MFHRPLFDATRSRAIPRRNVVAGMAALGMCGLVRRARAAPG